MRTSASISVRSCKRTVHSPLRRWGWWSSQKPLILRTLGQTYIIISLNLQLEINLELQNYIHLLCFFSSWVRQKARRMFANRNTARTATDFVISTSNAKSTVGCALYMDVSDVPITAITKTLIIRRINEPHWLRQQLFSWKVFVKCNII